MDPYALLDWAALVAGLVFTGLAAWSDLKTTEVSDAYPIALASTGILLAVARSVISGTLTPLGEALASGALMLAIGYGLFHAGQWGEGDALVLGGLGFLYPGAPSMFRLDLGFPLFPIVFLGIVFLVGGVYALAHCLVAWQKKKSIRRIAKRELAKKSREIAALVLVYEAVIVALWWKRMVWLSPWDFVVLSLGAVALTILVYYTLILARVVEGHYFVRVVPRERVREGDVLAREIRIGERVLGGKIVGLTREEVELLRKNGPERVEIKEGLRFVPCFFVGILVAWLVGLPLSP